MAFHVSDTTSPMFGQPPRAVSWSPSPGDPHKPSVWCSRAHPHPPVHLADHPATLCPQVESLTAARNACRAGAEPSDAIRVVNAVLTQIDQIKRYHCTRIPPALLPALPAQDASGIVSRHCLLYV